MFQVNRDNDNDKFFKVFIWASGVFTGLSILVLFFDSWSAAAIAGVACALGILARIEQASIHHYQSYRIITDASHPGSFEAEPAPLNAEPIIDINVCQNCKTKLIAQQKFCHICGIPRSV